MSDRGLERTEAWHESGHPAARFPSGHGPVLSAGPEPRAPATDLGRRALRGRAGSRTRGNLGSWREELESREAGRPEKREGRKHRLPLDLFPTF